MDLSNDHHSEADDYETTGRPLGPRLRFAGSLAQQRPHTTSSRRAPALRRNEGNSREKLLLVSVLLRPLGLLLARLRVAVECNFSCVVRDLDPAIGQARRRGLSY